MKSLKIFIALTFLILSVNAQNYLEKELSGYTNPDELVTLSETIPFNKAVDVLSKVSEKLTGKKIVSTMQIETPIGIQIDKMPYMKALLIIVQYNNLQFEERAEVIVISSKDAEANENLSDDVYAAVDSREVQISAVIFEAGVTEMRERGINWDLVLSKSGLELGTNFITFGDNANQESTTGGGTSEQSGQFSDFTVSGKSSFTSGDFSGDLTAAFKFFESENLGEVIARPSITVRDKKEGRIQIGSDISIKQRDFAGNVIDVFVSTGTIINVTPYIYREDGVDYVLLKLKVERSSANPDVVSTEIRKTEATTEVLLLNGEEVVIGGLYDNQETNVRRGIPILKDLPWWFFGLKYLFGFDSKQIIKKEVIILIKANIVPPLKDRIEIKKENLIRDKIKEDVNEIEKYKLNNLKEELR